MPNPFAGMPTTGIRNPFATGAGGQAFPFGDLVYHAPTKAQGYDPKAANPMVGSYSYEPQRQQLAQLMAPWQQQWFGHGPNYGSQGGSHYGGYTTSGPQSGGSGSVGGWGWGGGARSSATQGGMWGGIR